MQKLNYKPAKMTFKKHFLFQLKCCKANFSSNQKMPPNKIYPGFII